MTEIDSYDRDWYDKIKQYSIIQMLNWGLIVKDDIWWVLILKEEREVKQ